MCVIFFYVNSNPIPGGYKLILASNRDEFYARDTLKVHKWEKAAAHCYGGIDLEPGREGGTWLAISSLNGIIKVGALLNLTGEPTPRNAVGRGMLVADYVKSYDLDFNNENYNEHLVHDCTKYSAFNFISIELGDSSKPAKVSLVSNVPPSLTRYDEGQCYGFGNSLPQVPFIKVQQGTLRFEEIVKNFLDSQDNDDDNDLPQSRPEIVSIENESKENTQNFLVEKLMNLLKSKEKFWPDPEMERRAPNWGEYLSALNVNIPDSQYGSRTHSVILVDYENKMHFYEETMESLDPDASWCKSYIEEQFLK